MDRIMVMGVSAGVGKSTFARELGKKLGISVCHLDTLFWKPGWVQASLEEFAAGQQEIVKKDKWIMEGNYSNTTEIRAEMADTIIYLELPLRVCLYRVLKRWITNLGTNRPDMGDGCTEKMDFAFIKFIITTYYPRKKNTTARFQSLQEIGSHKKIITLKSKKEIRTYLATL
ncbi:topology modulation protein [Virgibacillus flavescens]|uniref:topology modulation protein n=1 Tax=Virgibacillus flavescens TaxID=1611422 RepID=UPI003D336C87